MQGWYKWLHFDQSLTRVIFAPWNLVLFVGGVNKELLSCALLAGWTILARNVCSVIVICSSSGLSFFFPKYLMIYQSISSFFMCFYSSLSGGMDQRSWLSNSIFRFFRTKRLIPSSVPNCPLLSLSALLFSFTSLFYSWLPGPLRGILKTDAKQFLTTPPPNHVD